MRQGRLLLAVILLMGALGATSAIAQSAGSELVEALGEDSAGDDAHIALESVDAFPPGGGEAVLEPGTPYEEILTYATVDGANSRLVGLTRSAPLAHSVGVFIQAPEAETSPPPEASASPSARPSEEPAEASPEEMGETDGETTEEPSTNEAAPNPCYLVLGQSCLDVLDPLDDLCDPGGLGQTCGEWLAAFVQEKPCVGESCQITTDPLGPWSVCDLDNADAECPDPDDVIDLVWSVDNPLIDLECEAGVSDPDLTEGGGMVKGRGWIDCGEAVILAKVWVCLHKNQGGAWIKMGCRTNESYEDSDGYASRKVVEPCAQKQTLTYRIRARGEGWDAGRQPDPIEFDSDSAKATAILYCPGPASSAAASQDALEYADSWLPDSD